MANKKILLGLTTDSGTRAWKDKVKAIDEFDIEEIGLFPTPLVRSQRNELYSLLEKTNLKSIPHVHLREQDFGRDEVDYLIKRYHTKVFNLHPSRMSVKFIEDNQDLKDIIFLENLNKIFENFGAMLEKCGGICLDFSHYKDFGLLQKEKSYSGFEELLDRYNIGCNHISAIKKTIQYLEDKQHNKLVGGYNDHYFSDLSEFDYVKEMPKRYFADYISIELENSFKEQLRVKEYLEKIINS